MRSDPSAHGNEPTILILRPKPYIFNNRQIKKDINNVISINLVTAIHLRESLHKIFVSNSK